MLDGGVVLHEGSDTLLVSGDVAKQSFNLLAGDATSPRVAFHALLLR